MKNGLTAGIRNVAQSEGSGAKNSAIGRDARDVTGDHRSHIKTSLLFTKKKKKNQGSYLDFVLTHSTLHHPPSLPLLNTFTMGAPAELFTLIEQFLQDQGCVNALKAFQKDAKNVRSPPTTPTSCFRELFILPPFSLELLT